MAAVEAETLDPSTIHLTLSLQAVRVDKTRTSQVMKTLKGHLLDRPRCKSVWPDPDDDMHRLVLLHERYAAAGGAQLPAEVTTKLEEGGFLPLVPHELRLDYSYFTAEQVLKKLLPEGMEIPGSFETVGHVAHINLRDSALPYKKLIGRVLLDKNGPRIRSIVNKVGTIENTYRVQQLELLAGDPCLETEVKQHGAVFKLDFGLVYWNSRLEREHWRLTVTYLHGSSTVVCDMMAGIGPFAVPAAQEGCTVYANDLNPDSTRYLAINAVANKVQSHVKVFTMCGRQFVRHLLGRPLPSEVAPEGTPSIVAPVRFHHVVMNLPATAIEFLDVFKGLFDAGDWTEGSLPMIHCYLFARTVETAEDIVKRGEYHLGGSIENAIVHPVRDVAPNKHMFCLSFKLSAAVAFAAEGNYEADGTRRPHHVEKAVVADVPPPSKRIRIDDSANVS